MQMPTAGLIQKAQDATYGAIQERAMVWLIWFRSGDATLADAQAFRRWRAQSPGHAQAVRELASVWQALRALAEIPGIQSCRSRDEPNLAAPHMVSPRSPDRRVERTPFAVHGPLNASCRGADGRQHHRDNDRLHVVRCRISRHRLRR